MTAIAGFITVRPSRKKKTLTPRDMRASSLMSLSTDSAFFCRGMLRLPRSLFRRKGKQA